MKLAVTVFAVLALSVLPAFSADNVPGEVLVVFQKPGSNDVTAESLAEGGEYSEWVKAEAEGLDAEVVNIYTNISVSGNEIMVLLRSHSGNGEGLLEELRMRPDVTASSLNYVRRMIRPRINTIRRID